MGEVEPFHCCGRKGLTPGCQILLCELSLESRQFDSGMSDFDSYNTGLVSILEFSSTC